MAVSGKIDDDVLVGQIIQALRRLSDMDKVKILKKVMDLEKKKTPPKSPAPQK